MKLNTVEEIVEKMKAFRLGAGISLRARLRVSRAAIYRYEFEHAIEIDTLANIADILNMSLPTLQGQQEL